ncbi:MAG: helix-turn-helix domain-containing protein [Pseudomonas sp.]
MHNRITVPAKLLLPILQDLSMHGDYQAQILNETDGRISATELLKGEVLALDLDDFVHVYGLSTRLLEQATCQERSRSTNRKEALKLFLTSLAASDTLKNACDHAAQFNSIMEERGFTIHLSPCEAWVRLTIDLNPSIERPPLTLVSSCIITFFNIFSWLTARQLTLKEIGFAYPRPPQGNPCVEILEVPIHYQCDQNYMAFDAQDLERKIVRRSGELNEMVDYIAYDPWFFLRSSAPISNQIRSFLLDAIQCDRRLPDSLAMAEQLGISPSTLARRLKLENSSFLKLKSECQLETAKFLLRKNALDISHIASRLGFVDVRSFRRAFLGWTGMLPSTFRAQSTPSVSDANAASNALTSHNR